VWLLHKSYRLESNDTGTLLHIRTISYKDEADDDYFIFSMVLNLIHACFVLGNNKRDLNIRS